jgi:hypothetical protein
MRNLRKRNLEIFQMSRAGAGHRAIARRFKRSRSSIDIIVRRLQEDEQLAKRNTKLLASIRRADDLDRRWPITDLFAALRLLAYTRTGLLRRFEECGTDTVSLRTLMNAAMPEPDSPDARSGLPPLPEVRGVGKKGFWSVGNQITALDLGARSNQEWERKLAKLKLFWRITGALPLSQPPKNTFG